MLAWIDESPSHRDSDCGVFIRFCQQTGLDKIGGGIGRYIASGTFHNPDLYTHPDRSRAAMRR